MPSTKTKEKKFFQSAIGLDPYSGEPLGEPPLPGLGEDRPAVSEELVERALEQARLRATVRDMPEQERERLVEGLLEQLGEDRGELPEGLRDRLLDGMLGELLAS